MWAGWSGVIASYVGFHILEWFYPVERDNRYRNLPVSLFASAVYLLLTPIANFLPGLVIATLVHRVSSPWFNLDLSGLLAKTSGAAHFALLVPLALLPLLIFDFFYYWLHRWQHTSRWVWEQHRLHHTEESMNVATSLRHHWLEEFLRSILIVAPMSLLFRITPIDAGVLTMLIGQWGYFTHANIRINCGPINRLFVSSQGHRIHHSVEALHRNKNFAAFFPVWDILFGTYHYPRWDEFPKTGLKGVPSNMPLREVVFGPFIGWCRMIKKVRGRALSTAVGRHD
jgi:sterol desaturase/sphingolipid hydroxylase (fatty acid hydroxylase superfamily)